MHHYYWSGGHPGGWMIFHGASWILLLAALLIGAVVLVRSMRSSSKERQGPTALDILDQRYARGEIDREEYFRRKSDILEGKSTTNPPEQ